MRRAELGSAPQTAYPPAARSASPLARVAPQPRRPPVPAPALPTGALGGAGGRAAAGGSGGSGKAGPRPGGSMPGPSRLGLVPARPVWTQARWRGEAHERLRWPEVQLCQGNKEVRRWHEQTWSLGIDWCLQLISEKSCKFLQLTLVLEPGNSKIKVLTDLVSGKSSLPGLLTAAFSRCPHSGEREKDFWCLFLLEY
ncbi:uncharacterized protein LOC116668556 isoform X1 [Camelus ferus]|uniref:Uncharacterized protein LOC116668556 isoform X1 n=1 Tax=Camelus ferus TaxID=419612 RepID=A0A8B8UCW1_CAMFR|nr:uncharacterized protein LOC116668556 isoform X1 [Camelus ferus]